MLRRGSLLIKSNNLFIRNKHTVNYPNNRRNNNNDDDWWLYVALLSTFMTYNYNYK
jgi:hypothetical protein